jgi:hypothetical protein
MGAGALPTPLRLNLAEAADLGTLLTSQAREAVIAAIERALDEGRIHNTPTPRRSHSESAAEERHAVSMGWGAELLSGLRRKNEEMERPVTFSSAQWKEWNRQARVDWSSGSVDIASGAIEHLLFPELWREDVVGLFAADGPPRKGKGGAPPAADWPAIEERLAQEIADVGFPHRGGAPGWRFAADVERYVEGLTGDAEPGRSAVKANVRRMLSNIKKGHKVGN